MYRKYKPDTIFNGWELLPAGMVLIIDTVGIVEAIVPEAEAGDNIELLDGMLSPGFVNAHCHIELSHMKGVIPQHTGLVEFVQQVLAKRETPANKSLSGEAYEQFLYYKLAAMKLATDELFESGTVAIGDICNTGDSISIKQNSPIYWHNFIEVSGFADAVAEKRLKGGEDLLLSFNHGYRPFGNTLAPHASYSVSKKLFEIINNKTSRQLISIHNQETAAENELYQSGNSAFLGLYKNLGINTELFSVTGKTSMQSWLPYFTNAQKIISVHNTFTSQDDFSFSNSPNLYFCICINANLYIENKLPPIDLMVKNNCNIVLGTDSYASNFNLNIMEEINSIQKNFPHIPLPSILKWATSNGARALGIDNKFGSFEKGKKPGLVLIDKDKGLAKKI